MAYYYKEIIKSDVQKSQKKNDRGPTSLRRVPFHCSSTPNAPGFHGSYAGFSASLNLEFETSAIFHFSSLLVYKVGWVDNESMDDVWKLRAWNFSSRR
jgi:hypothetical protein